VVLRLGMSEQAVVAARRAVELDSTDCDGFILLSRALDAQGETRDALVAMARAVDILRDPFRSAEAVEKEKLIPPLAFSRPPLVFTDFETIGDAANFSLSSTCAVAGVTTVIRIVLSGTEPAAPSGMESIGGGEIEKSGLSVSVPEKIAAVVAIFPQETLRYSLYRKKPVEGK
jgi:hypothetical protein